MTKRALWAVAAVLTMLLGIGGGVRLTAAASLTDDPPSGEGEYKLYLPLCIASEPAENQISIPVGRMVVVDSWGATNAGGHAAAYDPSGGGVWDANLVRTEDHSYMPADGGLGNASIATNDFGGYYLTRSYYEIILPQFEGRVASAHLEYRQVADCRGISEPLPAPTVAFHIGTWETADYESVNGRALWSAWGEVVATVDTTEWYAAETDSMPLDPNNGRWVEVALPLNLITSEGVLRLAMRDSEDHINLLRSDGVGEGRSSRPHRMYPMRLVIGLDA